MEKELNSIEDHKKFEHEALGLKYKSEDELTEEEKAKLDAQTPSEEVMKEVVKQLKPEPFGAPGITDTTKFDGNLAQQYKKPA